MVSFLESASQVFFGMAMIAAIALLIGAIFDIKVSDSARSTLWGVFWAGLIVGGILFYAVFTMRGLP